MISLAQFHETPRQVLGDHIAQRGSLVVGVTPDLTGRFNALNLVRVASEARSAARAAAGGPTWRGPAVPTASRPTRRWMIAAAMAVA